MKKRSTVAVGGVTQGRRDATPNRRYDKGAPLSSRLTYNKSGAGRAEMPAAPVIMHDGKRVRPDADFNVGSVRGGRILIPRQLLHPADDHVVDEHNLVDIAPLAGTQVRILLKGARLLFSCDMPTINTFIEFDAIEIAPGYEEARYKYVLVDPAWTCRAVYERWYEKWTPGSFRKSDEYKRMRLACRIPASERPRAKELNAAFEIQRAVGAFGFGDNLAHFPMVPATKAFVAASMRELIKARARDRIPANRNEPVSTEELMVLEPLLDGLRESCQDPRHAKRYAEPVDKVRQRLLALGPGRTMGVIFCYAAMGLRRRAEVPLSYMRSVRRFEDLAREVDPTFTFQDEAKLGAAFEEVAFGSGRSANFAPAVRDTICREVRVVLRKVRAFCLNRKSTVALKAVAPALHPEDRSFEDRLKSAYGQLRKEGQRRRKQRADRISNRYDRLVDGAAFRTAQIHNDGRAGRAALDLMAEEPDFVPYRQFEFTDGELDGQGLPTGRRLTRIWRCWRTEAAWASLRDADKSVRENGASVHYRETLVAERVSEIPKPFVFELVDVVVEGGEDPILPWYVDLSDAQVLMSSGNLEWPQRERRHASMLASGLPGYMGTPAGLLTFERDRSTLARIALGRPQPRRFFPLEEFEHAMLLAAHGLDSVVQTWCRPHEFMQQTAYLADWQRDPEDENDTDGAEAEWGFKSIRKLAPLNRMPDGPEFIEASEDLFVSGMTIVALLRRRFHDGGPVPLIEPNISTYKLKQQPYLFSSNGVMVPYQALTLMLRVLFAGIADVRFHDFRHSASNNARNKAVPLPIVQAGLGQRSIRLARYYSRLTAEQCMSWSLHLREERRHELAQSTRETW